MGFFKRKKECDPEAVCAYEYDGRLYKTKELRDKAKRQDEYDQLKADVARALAEFCCLKSPRDFYHRTPSEVDYQQLAGFVIHHIKVLDHILDEARRS